MEQVTKTDVEKKVERILKLIKRRSRKKEAEIIGLVEDINKQYQSLYAQYEHIKRKSGDKTPIGNGNESYPNYASGQESEYYSPTDVETETETPFDNNESSNRWMPDNINEELKRAYGEDAKPKPPLALKPKEKKAEASGHLASPSKTQEIENIGKDEVTGLKTGLESVHHQERDLEVRIDGKTAETEQSGEVNKAMYAQVLEERDEVTKLTKQIKDNENSLTSKIDDSMAHVCNLKKEVDCLRSQQCGAEGNIPCKSNELFDPVNVMEPEQGSLDNQREETTKKSGVELIMVEGNRGLRGQLMELGSEVDSLCKHKIKLEDELRSHIHDINQLREEKSHLNSRILELEALFREKGLELSAQDNKRKWVKETAQMSAEVEHLQQEMAMNDIEENTNQSMESDPKFVKPLSIGNKPLERKMEGLAQEFYQKVDDNISLLRLRIEVAEKTHYENKKSYNDIKERLEQENGALKQKLATCEAEFGKLTDNATTGLCSVVNNVDLETKLCEEEEQKLKLLKAVSVLENRVGELEKINKEKEETLSSRDEEKREAIRQLCVLIDYHRSRCDHLKGSISNLIVRIKRKT